MTSDLSIVGAPLTDIEIGATGIRGIAQNVQTILTTVRGTVFLDRTFGLPQDLTDTPMTVVRNRLVNEIVNEIEKQEPRVKVTAVTFEQSDAGDGELISRVGIKIRPWVLL